MHYKVNFELNYSRYLDYCELILHCIAFLIWSYLFPSYAHESCHHSFNSIGVSAAVQLPSWHQWVNGQLALYRFDALPRSLSPVTGRLFLAIKRYSNGAKKCDSFAGFLRQRHAQFGHTLIISKQAIVIIIIAILLHGPEAVNCAATLTTSGQTGDEAGRGASSKSKTDLKLPICIKSTRWWVDSNSKYDYDSASPTLAGIRLSACQMPFANCQWQQQTTWQLTMLTCQSLVPPSCHLLHTCTPLSFSLCHTNKGWWSIDR